VNKIYINYSVSQKNFFKKNLKFFFWGGGGTLLKFLRKNFFFPRQGSYMIPSRAGGPLRLASGFLKKNF